MEKWQVGPRVSCHPSSSTRRSAMAACSSSILGEDLVLALQRPPQKTQLGHTQILVFVDPLCMQKCHFNRVQCKKKCEKTWETMWSNYSLLRAQLRYPMNPVHYPVDAAQPSIYRATRLCSSTLLKPAWSISVREYVRVSSETCKKRWLFAQIHLILWHVISDDIIWLHCLNTHGVVGLHSQADWNLVPAMYKCLGPHTTC